MISVMPLCSLVLPGLLVLGQTDRTPAPPTRAAIALWQEGQEAMKKGDVPKALSCYQESQRLDPRLARVELSLAAAHLQAENQPRAAEHLRRYLDLEPGHWQIRQQLADLLSRLGHRALARRELELMLTSARAATSSDPKNPTDPEAINHLVHGHGRLMELAEEEGNLPQYHLHRGLGLFFLAKSIPDAASTQAPAKSAEIGALPDRQDLLLKSVRELLEAQRLSPSDTRSAWYLSKAWRELGQSNQADHWMQKVGMAHVPGELTPQEERELAVARGSKRLDLLLSAR